jgi:hypothetical protein
MEWNAQSNLERKRERTVCTHRVRLEERDEPDDVLPVLFPVQHRSLQRLGQNPVLERAVEEREISVCPARRRLSPPALLEMRRRRGRRRQPEVERVVCWYFGCPGRGRRCRGGGGGRPRSGGEPCVPPLHIGEQCADVRGRVRRGRPQVRRGLPLLWHRSRWDWSGWRWKSKRKKEAQVPN